MQAMVASPKIISLKEQASSMTMVHNSTSRFFSYRLRQSVLRQAKARYRESASKYQSTFLNAVREVDDSLLDLKSHTRELKLQLQTLESTTLSAQAAKDRYNTGLTDYFDYIIAEQIRLQTAARKATLTAEQLSASVRLIQALGGGFQTSRRYLMIFQEAIGDHSSEHFLQRTSLYLRVDFAILHPKPILRLS